MAIKLSKNNLSRIKRNRKKKTLFLKIDGREAIIFPNKYGERWWKNATISDLRRIAVF